MYEHKSLEQIEAEIELGHWLLYELPRIIVRWIKALMRRGK